MIEVVSATRRSQDQFWRTSALGRSLPRLVQTHRLIARVAFENRRGLPEVYNERICAPDRRDLLLFVHDDIWIDDYFLTERVVEGLQTYDVIGVVGNRRRVRHQPSWLFLSVDDRAAEKDSEENLSGSLAHGARPFGPVSYYGAIPSDCELLDGLFLAVKKSTLTEHELLFDPQFDFHFYDVDFCRAARQRGLRLGTWPIAITHQSYGEVYSEQWKKNRQIYFDKWKS